MRKTSIIIYKTNTNQFRDFEAAICTIKQREKLLYAQYFGNDLAS